MESRCWPPEVGGRKTLIMLSLDLVLDLLFGVGGQWFLCRAEEAEGWEEEDGLNEHPSLICSQLGNLRKMVSNDPLSLSKSSENNRTQAFTLTRI